MNTPDPDGRLHWDEVYARKDEAELSWFEHVPELSLELIAATGARPDWRIVDIGGGASRLVDCLLDHGFTDLTVLDLSPKALAQARSRLGGRADRVTWIAADVTSWTPPMQYDVWHDRAAFHFLTDADDRRRYVETLEGALAPHGHTIIATFAPDGPEKCSGLPVARYDPEGLADVLGPGFRLAEARRRRHATPWGSTQSFQFSRFVRS